MFQWKWMTNEAALEIVEWEYNDNLSFYNIQNNLDDLDEFLNPFKWNHYAAIYEGEGLVGYFTFDPLNIHEVEINIGLHPDLVGKGKGYSFAEYAIKTAIEWYEPKKLLVDIPEFNQRAIRLFEKQGFQTVNRSLNILNGEEYLFVRMEKAIV
ncbi:GNAT family N-acetyltransferase [Salipaludibacillus daqingensis]|uniref:GNAT family N-acetyltransferase n=1 Tax=Salipaludibacillus daqingensis TaxID=3041001 RepID=UPI002474170F|nr:GNAT family N-acetyltransferase [Salipaludibacillus daqingensis]